MTAPKNIALSANVEVDEDTRRVILELATGNDARRPYVRVLAQDLDMPVEHLRRILIKLSKADLVTYGPINDDDGRPQGSTYWLTAAGAQLQASLEAA